jgi:hypothetical protein
MSDIFAEDVGHYWKTSKTGADTWIDKAVSLITKHGGKPLQRFSGWDMASGRSAFMIAFEMDGDVFKITWPVLKSKTKNERAARVQSATLLYHSVKGRLLEAKIRGPRAAFFGFLTLPDGRSASELGTHELSEYSGLFNTPQLESGDIVEAKI